MRKKDIGPILIVLMFIVVGFAYFMGWVAIENQNITFSNIKARQYVLVRTVNSLRDSLSGLKKRSEGMAISLEDIGKNLNVLKTALGNNEMTIKEAFSHINDINGKLAMWQTNYNGIVSRLNKLSDEVKLSEEKRVKKINLGKVSVEKEVAQNVENKATE